MFPVIIQTNKLYCRFPSNPERKRTWIEAAGRHDWQPTKYSKICSVHFDEDSFVYKRKRIQLKECSVPTKYVHVSIHCSINIII